MRNLDRSFTAPSQWPQPPRVLLVRTDHLGDMLLTLPMADALKRAWPGSHVAVLASSANAEAARHHPSVDQVLTDFCEAKGSGLRHLRPLVRLLRAGRFDVAVVVHPTPRLALAAWAARIPVRVGTAYRAYSLLFNVRVRQHRRGSACHESRLNLELLAGLGIEPESDTPELKWQFSAEEEARTEDVLRERGITGPFAVLHPGSGGSAWNWPPQHYASLGRRLSEAGLQIVVTGSAREQALAEAVASQVGGGAVNLAGTLSLGELAVLLRRARLFVGGSTGPTHLAALLGTPVVALYAPLRSQWPERWRPLGPRVSVVQPAVGKVCAKCEGPRCEFFFCMARHLEVDRVFASAQRWLAEPAAARLR
jgi:lipopolysaccharide heptosyltransferase II